MKKIFSVVAGAVLLVVIVVLLLSVLFRPTNTLALGVELPDKVSYLEGETFDNNGLVVNAFKANGKVVVVSEDDYHITKPNLSTAGSKLVVIRYDKIEYEFHVEVKKDPKTVLAVYLSNFANTVFYNVAPTTANISLAGVELTLQHLDGTTSNANLNLFDVVVTKAEGITDSGYQVYIVMLDHKTLEGISTAFYVYSQA